MKQEDKQLLLQDLSARLPYGVKVKITSRDSKNRIVHLTENNICHLTSGWWSECKPYLFPLSSMTEEQKFEFTVLQVETLKSSYATPMECVTILQWCYKNHIDVSGLIPKGLAIDTTRLNIY